jgi:hypothetical protein
MGKRYPKGRSPITCWRSIQKQEISPMAKLEEKGITGVKGLIFDLYNTLIDIKTDEDSINTYEPVSKWLIYQGIRISPEDLMRDYKRLVKEDLESRWEMYPEAKLLERFASNMRYGASMRSDWAKRPLAPFVPDPCEGSRPFLRAGVS